MLRQLVASSATVTLACATLAACGGGGSGSGAVPASAAASPTAPIVSPAGNTRAKFTFVIPATQRTSATARSPQYIPSDVASVKFSILAVNGSVPSPAPTPAVFNITPSAGSGCTGNGSTTPYTCTFSVGMPVGTDFTQISAYSAANAGGLLLSQFVGTLPIVNGAANVFGGTTPLTLDANPGRVSVTALSNVTGTVPYFLASLSVTPTFTVALESATGNAFTNEPGKPTLSAATTGTGGTATISGSTLTVTTPTGPSSNVVLEAIPAGTLDVTASLTAAAAAGASSIAVNSAAGIYLGANLVLDQGTFATGATSLIQESSTVAAVNGTTLTLKAPLSFAHASGASVQHFTDNLTPQGTSFVVAPWSLLQAPTAVASPAGYNFPAGVAVDGSNNVYVADTNNNRIVKITSSGTLSVLPQPTIPYSNPKGVAVDSSGNVYVADSNNNRIVMTGGGGTGTPTVLPTPGAPVSPAGWNQPYGLAVDNSGNLYVADSNNNRVVKVPNGGTGSPTVLPTPSSGEGIPTGVAVDSGGIVYVADNFFHHVIKITGSTAVNLPTTPSFYFTGPFGVAVDSARNLYVTDNGSLRVTKLTYVSSVESVLPAPAAPLSPTGYLNPLGIAINSAGVMYVADSTGNRIIEYLP